MESEGNENHGVHVCHKCGWAFPNPHPSAKHRRAHKKVCGKIDGFKIAGSEDKSHSDSDSDEDHKFTKSVAKGSGEKVSGIVAEGATKSQGEVFSDAVTEFADAESQNTAEEIGNSDKKTNTAEEPTHHNNSGNFLLSSASPLEPEERTKYSTENPDISSSEDVNSSVAVGSRDTDAGGNGESTVAKILSATTTLAATGVEVSSDFTNISTITTMDDSSKDTVMDLKVPDITIFQAHEDQANALGHQIPQSEMHSQSGIVEVEAGEHHGAFVDTQQVSKGTVHIDSRVEMDGTTTEKFSTFEELPARNSSELKSDACKDHMTLKPEVTQTLTSVEETGNNYLSGGPLLEEARSGAMPIKSAESADLFPTTMRVQEDNLRVDVPSGKSMSNETVVDQSGVEEDLNEEGSQPIGINSSECTIEELDSHGLGTHSDSTKAFIPDDAVMGSIEIDATQSHSEDNKPALSLGETPMVPVSGGNITVSTAGTEVHKEIAEESGNYNFVHEETRIAHTTVVRDYSEEGTNDGNFLSITQVTPDTLINATEMKNQLYEDAGMNEVEGNLQLTDTTHTDTTIDSKGMDANSSSVEDVLDIYASQQSLRNEVSHEISKEIDTFSDPSLVKTEKEVEKIQTDGSSEEKLNQTSEIGLCQVDVQNPTPEEPVSSAVDSESCVQSSCVSDNNGMKDLTDRDASEGGDTILKQGASASVLTVDASVDSISQTDCVEPYWGFISDVTVPPTRDATDTMPIVSTETLPDVDVQTPKQASVTDSNKQSPADNTDICDAPSFMTLVEPNSGGNRQQASAENQSAQNPRCTSSPPSQAGWFPSLTNVVNESPGRKKNDEIIAKVVSLSSGKPHTPLRSLLDDAIIDGKHDVSHTELDHTSPKTRDGPAPEGEDAPAKPALEVSTIPAAKEATEKEWNSPARLPVIKREKRKFRAYWAPFVCCSSIN